MRWWLLRNIVRREGRRVYERGRRGNVERVDIELWIHWLMLGLLVEEGVVEVAGRDDMGWLHFSLGSRDEDGADNGMRSSEDTDNDILWEDGRTVGI
jgi:hypothetical protein